MSQKENSLQPLWTEEGEKLSGMPWNVYPRPRMRRRDWMCLNGDWDYIVDANDDRERTIRVSFCPEGLLSGIHESLPPAARPARGRSAFA